MKKRVQLVLWLLAGILVSETSYAASSVNSDLCPVQVFAKRSGSESCWAKYPLSEGGTLCISRTLWWERLKSPVPDPLCGLWSGHWKASAPLLNPLPNDRVNPQKEVRLRFYALRFPPAATAGSGVRISRWAECSAVLAWERFRERVSEMLRRGDRLGVARKLILDEDVPQSPLPLLRLLGFVHLFTVSGIHLYALALYTGWFFSSLGMMLGLSVRRSRVASQVSSVLLWGVVWALTGMRAGLLRPLCVVSARKLAGFLGFRWRGGAPLLFALGLDLVIASAIAWLGPSQAPASTAGRWHYALAVGGGLWALDWAQHRQLRPLWKQRILEHTSLALGSWVLVAVCDTWVSGTVALSTPFLSLITLPWVTIAFFPLALLSVAALGLGADLVGQSLAWVATEMCSQGISFLAWISISVPGLWVVHRGAFLASAVISGIILIVGNSSLKKTSALLLPVLFGFLLFGALPHSQQPSTQAALADQVEQLDVGQGDAALIRWGSSAGLIDSGSEQALTDSDWIRILASRGVNELSWVALTHLDEDHVGGLRRLARLVPIKCVAIAEDQLIAARGQVLSAELFSASIPLIKEQVPERPVPLLTPETKSCIGFSSFSSDLPEGGGHPKNGNDKMRAYWIPLRSGKNYLSMGDAAALQELGMASWAQARPSYGTGKLILKISHHGSKSSTSSRLLRMLKPSEAWISAGAGNSYGHPAPQTLSTLQEIGVEVRRTDREGSLAPR